MQLFACRKKTDLMKKRKCHVPQKAITYYMWIQ